MHSVNPAEEDHKTVCVFMLFRGAKEHFSLSNHITEVKIMPSQKILSEKQKIVEALSEDVYKRQAELYQKSYRYE